MNEFDMSEPEQKTRRATRELQDYWLTLHTDYAFMDCIAMLMGTMLYRNSAEPQEMREIRKRWAKLAGFAAMRCDGLGQYFRRMLLPRAVDAFEFYLASLLNRLFKERTDMLKTGKSHITYEELIRLGSMDSFYQWAAEKKVMELMYSGLPKVLAYLKQMGIQYTDSGKFTEEACEAVEIRHILIHNNGLVSHKFIENTRYKDLAVGQPFHLDNGHLSRGMISLLMVATSIDMAAVAHFGLETVEYGSRIEDPRFAAAVKVIMESGPESSSTESGII